jgi:hypothetical protein
MLGKINVINRYKASCIFYAIIQFIQLKINNMNIFINIINKYIHIIN